MLKFSVITPSFNMLEYLKRCFLSVADQEGMTKEHIIIDGDSNDGTKEWLKNTKMVNHISEKDKGMYDAINKGLSMADGEILSYLNCDEQYLPNTLYFVKRYFEQNPEIDVVFGDALLIKPSGSLISYRKGYPLRWFYILSSHLYLLSCTMFFRRKIITDGIRFNDQLRDIGDQDFVVRILCNGYQTAHVNRYLAAFTVTGKNMCTGKNADLEKRNSIERAPKWVKLLRWPLNVLRLSEKLLNGAYMQKFPLEYSVYNSGSAIERKTFRVNKASFRWPYNIIK